MAYGPYPDWDPFADEAREWKAWQAEHDAAIDASMANDPTVGVALADAERDLERDRRDFRRWRVSEAAYDQRMRNVGVSA